MEKLFNEIWFIDGFNKYEPNREVIQKLKIALTGLSILIVLDTKCKHVKKIIPGLFKVMMMADFVNYKIHYTTVFELPIMAQNRLHIVRVPTIIFLKTRFEIGRITETTEKREIIEEEILYILKNKTTL